MKKLILKIDVSKINKANIVDRKFTTQDGTPVVTKELTLELIELKAPKFIKEGADWQMFKTHFIAEPQTKEQRERKEKSNILGGGIEFRNKVDPTMGDVEYPMKDNTTSPDEHGNVISLDEIPF